MDKTIANPSEDSVNQTNGDSVLLPTRRFAYIDLIEALAISFVIIYHVGMYPKNILSDSSLLAYFNYWLTGLLSVCVPVFFFANGFLLFGKPFNLERHIKKIVLIIAVLFFWRFAIPLVLIPATNQEFTLIEFLHIAWDFKIGWNNQLWFLETLICLYIVFPLLKLAFDNSRKVFLFFLTVCAICTFGNTILDELATMARACLTDNTGLVGFNFFGGINLFTGIKGYAFVYFCAGGLVHEKLDLIEKIPATKRLVVSIATIAISMTLLTLWGGYASFLSGKLWDNVYSAYDTIFTFAMTLSLFAICLSYKGKHRAINKIVMTISKNTLGIFILHYPVKVIFRLACPQLFATGTIFCTLPGSLIYALIILAISLVLTLLLKKIPLIRKLV